MELGYTPEQRLLQDSVRRYMATEYDFGARQKALREPDGFSRARWMEFAELGWLAAGFSEAAGGFGGSAVETALVMEGAGAGLVVEPLLSCAVLAGETLAGLGEAGAERLSDLLAGERLFALAHQEAEAGGDLAYVAARAERSGNGYRLSGRKAVALGAPSADEVLVTARTAGGAEDEMGVSLFAVGRAELDGRLRSCRTLDDLGGADIALDGLELNADARLGGEGEGAPAVLRALDHAVVAACAEAVGAMDRSLTLTLEHLKTRRQFGTPLASFQALQHRVADMAIALEQARSAVLVGLAGLESGDSRERARASSAAKVRTAESASFIGAQAVQLHGGIGLTDEHVISHLFKKLTVFQGRFGGAEQHLERFTRLS